MDIEDYTNDIHTADSMELLEELPENSVHACVTDPPYGLAFMGRDWDDFDPREYQDFCENWARRIRRVLKPGGHLLAFSGNRTHHRAFAGVEDAGFEIRDTLTWHYGSGFPKASDIGKTIDKRADAERELGPERVNPDGGKYSDRNPELNSTDHGDKSVDTHETLPNTDAAKKWDGWKTGLKPATEYVVMARKPFDGATVDCVQEHGTGALNIEACRVGDEERENGPATPGEETFNQSYEGDYDGETVEGRYPSNVVFHEGEAERLDKQAGPREGGNWPSSREGLGGESTYGDATGQDGLEARSDDTVYFYTSKASKSERTDNGSIDNAHPTVKPQDLMEWLVQLVTRQDQIVLDPFAGSGTTCLAAKNKHRSFIGVEKQPWWADVARARCGLTPHDAGHVNPDDGQATMQDF